MKKLPFKIRSAYGQLVALVFLPIAVLAMVGSGLIFYEVKTALHAKQDALADSALAQFELKLNHHLADDHQGVSDDFFYQSSPSQVRRMAVLDQNQNTVISYGGYDGDTPLNQEVARVLADNRGKFSRQKTTNGTSYGRQIKINDKDYYLMVEMDDEPLVVHIYKAMLPPALMGLMTLIVLLFILNNYSKRWISPIYEMRLFLQKLNSDTLDRTIRTNAEGEFSLLQRDFVQAMRRLSVNFNELKKNANETERELQQSLDELEERHALMQATHKDAMGISQAKSDFLANISHELRTPLNSIDGFTSLLARQEGLSGQQTLYVQTIKKSSAHLLALVNDVLDFSKIDAGKLILEHHEFDLYSSIYDVVDMLSPSALEKQLRLCVLIYNDVPSKIMGDGLRVKQILTNLVGNAIKFTDSGGVVVKVGLADTDGFVHVSVEDTGKGISDKDKEHLFKSFSQGDLSVTRRYGGTGLGLVISRELVKKMGGNIGFWDNATHNKAKRGATFWFEIPTGTTEIGEPDIPDCLNRPINILVWINHAPTRKMLKSALAGTQVSLYFSIGFADLLEQLDKKNHGFDWVIVDYFGQEASLDDVGAVLRQIRQRYGGHLATYGYQVGMDTRLLKECQAQALYEPMDKRQLFAMLCHERIDDLDNVITFDGIRVLAVDDYQPNLLMLQAYLEELGVDVVEAQSGFDAIDVMTKDAMGEILPIDLVFMDIQMPHMSGLDATLQIRKIQKDHHRPPVPIIALTAHGLADEKERLMASGMNDYASKPVSSENLIQFLQKWLDKGHTQNSPFVVDNTPSKSQNESSALADIDWQDARQRAGSKDDLAKKMLTTLISTAPTEKHALERAWADRDRRQLADLAHRLVGASRYTGVPRLRRASESFEMVCRDKLDDVSDGGFVHIRPSYRELIDALDGLGAVNLDEWMG